MSQFWDDRYSAKEYVFGEKPNIFFAEQLDTLTPGTIVLACEGEGRNAVYAASKGWRVLAFDSSEAGRAKAMELAKKHGVTFEYAIADVNAISYPEQSVDVVAFVYAHFPPEYRGAIHKRAGSWLKPGGRIILEAFTPRQLGNTSGGPKDADRLYTEELLTSDFVDLKTELMETRRLELTEGKGHEGAADIIRFAGSKQK